MNPDPWLALATWSGTHALALFWVLLGALLLVVGLAVWFWQGPLLRRVHATLPQPAVLLLNVAGGFLIVVAGAAGFAEIAEQLGPGGRMALADEAFSAQVGRHTPAGALQAFALLTHLGDVRVLAILGVAVALLLWWRRQRALALGWVLALAGNAVLNPTLKRIFERVRPLHEHGLVSEPGWSFPSGHTSGATVAYGMLAYVMLRTLPRGWHLPAVLAATGLAFTVASSRVFLRVHYVSDVLAGFASGTAWLMVCILSVVLSQRWAGAGWRRLNP
jgi:undecaprenyl-diphosphatase